MHTQHNMKIPKNSKHETGQIQHNDYKHHSESNNKKETKNYNKHKKTQTN